MSTLSERKICISTWKMCWLKKNCSFSLQKLMHSWSNEFFCQIRIVSHHHHCVNRCHDEITTSILIILANQPAVVRPPPLDHLLHQYHAKPAQIMIMPLTHLKDFEAEDVEDAQQRIPGPAVGRSTVRHLLRPHPERPTQAYK
jgi:hypothetical protein